MAKRRGNNEGSVYQRKDGVWCASVSLDDGKRRVFYGRTREEAASKLTDALAATKANLPLPPERLTVKAYMESWLDQKKADLRPLAYKAYKSKTDGHIIPDLGRERLAKLTVGRVQKWLNDKSDSGLAPKMVGELRAVLRAALHDAMRDSLVHRNVAALARPPKREHRQVEPLDLERAGDFLKHAQDSRLAALYTVALAVGLRRGEALGLAWDAIDLDRGVLEVRRQLQRYEGALHLDDVVKTKSSRRKIALPAFAVAALREHKDRQVWERRQAGEKWQDTGLVFTSTVGTPLDPDNLKRDFGRLRKAAGVPAFRFHDLRHTCATLLLVQGVPLRVIMDLLGHSQIGVTANLYSHVLPVLQREAANQMDVLFAANQ